MRDSRELRILIDPTPAVPALSRRSTDGLAERLERGPL